MQWHRVEDKMPDKFISVLGYMPDQAPYPTVRECYYTGNDDNGNPNFFAPGLGEFVGVTHWAEMPEFEEEA